MSKLFVTIQAFYPQNNGGKIASRQYFKLIKPDVLISFYDAESTSDQEYKAKLTNELGFNDSYLFAHKISIRNKPFELLKTFIRMVIKKQPYLSAKYFNKRFIKKIQQVIVEKKIEEIILDHDNLLYLLPYIRKVSDSVRIFVISHNYEAQIARDYCKNQKNIMIRTISCIESVLIKNFYRKYLPLINKLYCISDDDRNSFKETFDNVTVEYLPMPYEVKQYCDYQFIDNNNVGICGSLSWPPNVEAIEWYLKKVHPSLCSMIPDYKLIVAGSGASTKLIKLLEKTKNVEYLGYVEDIMDFYKQVSVVASPLLSGSGIRIKILDAFAHCKPVVASRKAIQGLLLGDDEVYIADDEKQFADKVYQLLNDNHAQRNLVQASNMYLMRDHSDVPLYQFFSKDLISVIIPCYNSYSTISYTLKELLGMEGDYVKEIIVVDSSDDVRTRKIIDGYGDKIKKIYLEEKTIPAIGRNIGAEEATGEVLAFIDSDAYPEPDWAEKIARAYSKGCLVGGGSYLVPGFQLKSKISLAQYFLQFSEFIGGQKQVVEFVPSCNVFCQKEFFDSLGGFPDIRAMEDVEFGRKASKESDMYYFPDMKVFHIFREEKDAYYKNQKMLGFYNAVSRKNESDSILFNKHVARALYLLFFVKKMILVTKRSVTKGPKNIGYFFQSIVMLKIGVFYWTIGFVQGCGEEMKNDNV